MCNLVVIKGAKQSHHDHLHRLLRRYLVLFADCNGAEIPYFYFFEVKETDNRANIDRITPQYAFYRHEEILCEGVFKRNERFLRLIR